MDPIMMGIAAVVVIVILAGVFFMQKKGKANSPAAQTPTNRPKTLAEQQRELELQRQAQAPSALTPYDSMPSTSDFASIQASQHLAPQNIAESIPTAATSSSDQDLEAVDLLLQQHDYSGAITLLRQAITRHPRNGDLHFSLLNAYALSKDYTNFDAFFPEVLALNDFVTTNQANKLKTLVDEEKTLTSKASQETTSAPLSQDDTLEFDLFDFNNIEKAEDNRKATATAPTNTTLSPQSAPTATHTAPVIEANTTTAAAAVATTQLDKTDDFSFDFELEDQPTFAPAATQAIAPVNPTQDILSLDEFVLEAPTQTVTPQPNGPHITETNIAEPNIAETNTVTSPVADTPNFKTSAPTTQGSVLVDDDFDFDFDFDETKTLVTKSISTPMAADTDTDTTTAPALSLELTDDFSFDLAQTDTATDGTLAANVSPNLEVPNLEIHTPKQAEEESLIADFASFDLEPSVPTPPVVVDTAPNVQTPADEFLLTVDDAQQPQPAAATHPTIPAIADITPLDALITDAPVVEDVRLEPSSRTELDNPEASTLQAPVLEDLAAAFDDIKALDTATLNVDLAEAYVNLGEYDSAKRLLDEVKDSEDTALLARIATLRQSIA